MIQSLYRYRDISLYVIFAVTEFIYCKISENINYISALKKSFSYFLTRTLLLKSLKCIPRAFSKCGARLWISVKTNISKSRRFAFIKRHFYVFHMAGPDVTHIARQMEMTLLNSKSKRKRKRAKSRKNQLHIIK